MIKRLEQIGDYDAVADEQVGTTNITFQQALNAIPIIVIRYGIAWSTPTQEAIERITIALQREEDTDIQGLATTALVFLRYIMKSPNQVA